LWSILTRQIDGRGGLGLVFKLIAKYIRKPQRVLYLVCAMLHTSPGRTKEEYKNGSGREARPTIVDERVGIRLAPTGDETKCCG
jgi:hypothetical protein